MKTHIRQKDWLLLPQDTRVTMVNKFAINRSEGVIVMGGEIRSDGCSQQDLIDGLSISKLLNFLGDDWTQVPNEDLFDHLLELTLNKLNGITKQAQLKEEEGTTKGSKKTKGVSKANTRSVKPRRPNRKRSASNASGR